MSSRDASLNRNRAQRSINNMIAKNCLLKSEITIDLEDNRFASQIGSDKKIEIENNQSINEYAIEEDVNIPLKPYIESYNQSSICEFQNKQSKPATIVSKDPEALSVTFEPRRSAKGERSVDIYRDRKRGYEPKGDRLKNIIRAFKEGPNNRKNADKNAKTQFSNNYKVVSTKPKKTFTSHKNFQIMFNKAEKIKRPKPLKDFECINNENYSGIDIKNPTKVYGQPMSPSHKKVSEGIGNPKIKRLKIKFLDDELKKGDTFTSHDKNRKKNNYKKEASIRPVGKNMPSRYIPKNIKAYGYELCNKRNTKNLNKEYDMEKSLNNKSGLKTTLLKQKSFKKLFIK